MQNSLAIQLCPFTGEEPNRSRWPGDENFLIDNFSNAICRLLKKNTLNKIIKFPGPLNSTSKNNSTMNFMYSNHREFYT